MFEIIIADKAKQDIKETLLYIKNSLGNPKAASALADKIEYEISTLSEFPFSGTPVQDQFLADSGFRFLLIKKFKAYYIADKENNTVSIVRFLYAGRDYESILKDEIS